MQRNQVFLVLVLGMLLLIGAIQIADPGQSTTKNRVPLSSAPEQQARIAVEQLSEIDHTQIERTRIRAPNGSIRNSGYFRLTVSHNTREFEQKLGKSKIEPVTCEYGSDGAGWISYAACEQAYSGSILRRYPTGASLIGQSVESAPQDAAIKLDNTTTRIIRVESNSWVQQLFASTYSSWPTVRPASAEIYINKSTGNITYIRAEQKLPERSTVIYDIEITEFGTASVDRPDSIPGYTLKEFWGDLTHGPIIG